LLVSIIKGFGGREGEGGWCSGSARRANIKKKKLKSEVS